MNTAPAYTPEGQLYAPTGYDQYQAAPKKDHRWLALVVAAIVLVALTAGGLLVVRSTQSSTDAQAALITKQADQTATTARSAASVPQTTAATDPATTVAPTAGNNVTPAGNTGNNNGVPAPVTTPKPAAPVTTAPPKPAAPAPVITSFTTPENIDCHNGNFQTFSASWTTTNAVKTTISIDGPGVYKTYGANGSDSLPFNCSTPHTFLLTAYGQDGHTVTKSITLQPRNVQAPAQPGDDQ